MVWYVFLITIPAVFFLGQIAVELIGRPIQTIFRLRQDVLERLLAFRNVSLPRPRETAVSSHPGAPGGRTARGHPGGATSWTMSPSLR